MSQQFPPTPPGQYPPQYGQPQYRGGPYGGPQARTSGAAIGSLVCGILGCIPFVTSLLAVILGFVGLGATSKPGVSGRGLAITGLILGIVGLLGWSVGSYSIYWGFGKVQELAGEGVKTFLTPLIEGDLTKALAETSMTEDELSAMRQKLQGWGQLTAVKMTWSGMSAENVNGQTNITMRGTATFSQAGDKPFRVVLDDKSSPGKIKVRSLTFE